MNVDFGALLSSGFIPGWALVAIVAVAYLRHRAANRTADAAITSGEWERLSKWNQRLQDECEACHRERDEARAEALKWKAIAEGIGQIRTAQAIADAERRQAEREGGE